MADKFTEDFLRAMNGKTTGVSAPAVSPSASGADNFTKQYLAAMGAGETAAKVQTPAAPYKLQTVLNPAAKATSVTAPKAADTAKKNVDTTSETEFDPVTGFELPTTKAALADAKPYATGAASAVMSGLDQFQTGMSKTADWLLGRPLQAIGWENNPISAWNKKAQADQQQNINYFGEKTKGFSDTGKKAVEVGGQVVAALPNAVLALMTAGSSLAAQGTTAGLEAASAIGTAAPATTKLAGLARTVGDGITAMVKDPNYWLSFGQVAGDNYETAKADGADDLHATTYAVLNGLLNAEVEVGGGGIQTLPYQLKTGGAKGVKAWVDSMLDEGKEEVVQGVIERLLQNVTYNKGNAIASVKDENAILNPVTSAKEFAGGAVVGGILGGGQMLANGEFKSKSGPVVNTETKRAAAVNPQDSTTRPTAAQEVAQGDTAVTTQDGVETPQSAKQAVAEGNAAKTVDSILSGDVSNSKAESIIRDPALRQAFEEKSGEKLTGTKSEMRGQIKDYAAALEAQREIEAKITGELPSGVGAMSNPFAPRQEVSKVFTNTYQKTDSINDAERAQMKPEDYTYDVIGHAQNESASQQRVDVDYEGEAADLYAKQDWTGEDVFTAKKILDKVAEKARETGDYSEFNKWTKAIQQRGTSGGQTIEAFKAFQKTPEGAVIKAQQVIAEAEKKLTKKKELGKDVDNSTGRKLQAEKEQTVKAVTNEANEAAKSLNTFDVAVEWWVRDTSIKLSEKIAKNAEDKGASKKAETTMQAMLKDLVRITSGAAPQGDTVKTKSTAATDSLRNYWANPEQYEAAVQRAQRYINEQYANDPESLAVFNDWLSGSGINTWQLIGKALQENGVNFNEILMSSWQDKAKLLDQVTKRILADTDLTQEESAKAAQYISDKFYDELAQRAQKKVEQLLKPTNHKQQKTMAQRINEFINSGVFSDEAIAELIKAKYGIPTLTSADVQKIYELSKLAQEASNDYQKRAFLNRAAMVIADKMPVTKKNKVLAVRRIAMLLNPKTLISRNAGGNVIFGLLEDIKDALGTLIDKAVSKKTGQRTTSYNPFATSKAEFLGAKKGLVEWGKDIKNGVDTSPTEHEMPRSSALKSKIGSATEEALNKLLQLGDRPFFEAAKAKRLDEMKRLGLDYTSEDAIADATAYALERVFQNNSALAKRAMQMRDSLGVLGDIAIPFAQTPSNILDKLIDYSPYGYVRAIKKAGTVGDSAWSQKQFVDTLARSMTGTGLIAFGFAAAMNGLLTGGGDDGEDEGETYQNKVSGWQPYSVFVDGKSYTYDWATVGGVLLGFGADMANMADGKADVLSILMNGTTMGINTLFNQSYLTGVSDLFGGDDIGKGIENMLIGLPSSFTPTALQQIARIVDPVSRDTYDKNGFVRAWNKVKAKLPGLSMTLPAKIGADGKEMTNFQGGTLSNIFESVLSPGYINKQRSTAIDTEVQRLYANTKVTAVLPNWSEYTSKSDLTFTTNKVEYEMSSAEWETYQKTRGKYTYKALDTLFKSSEYKKMGDDERVKAISDVYSDATVEAKRKIVEARGEMYLPTDGDVKKVDGYKAAGLSEDKAYSLYKAMDALVPETGKSEVSSQQKAKVVVQQGYGPKQTAALVGSLWNQSGAEEKKTLLPSLNVAQRLVTMYVSGGDSKLVSMTVPRSFSENNVAYTLTDAEMELFQTTYADYFNRNANNVMSEENLLRLREDAYNRAKYAVLRDRK